MTGVAAGVVLASVLFFFMRDEPYVAWAFAVFIWVYTISMVVSAVVNANVKAGT
jgi:hypothetical protein